jgi:hypothetical protein
MNLNEILPAKKPDMISAMMVIINAGLSQGNRVLIKSAIFRAQTAYSKPE